MTAMRLLAEQRHEQAIARQAVAALHLEVRTYPKPGLVSHIDNGAHDDMDHLLLHRSATALEPYFARLAVAGANAARMSQLRMIGIEGEAAMLAVTGGVNTHRGAIFGMGLLCAAAGFRQSYRTTRLGEIVGALWATDIVRGPVPLHSHGSEVARKHGAGGARLEAAAGFPSVYEKAIPALDEGRALAPGDAEAARVHAIMRLIASVEDTNLLYRGGPDGLAFAQREAQRFLDIGSVGNCAWRRFAIGIHRDFVARRLSPGGCADLLAMALFVQGVER
ncbi:triphosphoribosyl-dephospho-CoA synthase MdcB [Sphingomonas sp. M1-B02]|uniref:triphosphoribosyl-dephospho-CoA synthase MdcB n=1 Tax=Sphingomonas sp. M1-B02 TaxID=3114300 RepID=UPI0022408C2E|nr:triphosphoribosyl-dephospho-CoA synthase MdcB [Sphingomonas sp. S6-11]UZK66304.1 triphosphoribosyl-dephospho-CoA synthase MdcB [Sphingomonas sp. S6-11]